MLTASDIRAKKPFIHCLMNTVAQAITANTLLALGAEPAMALHKDEVAAIAARADAVLINLGTWDEARAAALAALPDLACPVVLDPVFVQHSPLRLAIARKVMAAQSLIIKGNAAEMAALAPFIPAHAIRVITGATNRIEAAGKAMEIPGGHPLMASITGMGCALGGAIAAFACIAPDGMAAAEAALSLFARAGERAGQLAYGPGSFAPLFLDALYAESKPHDDFDPLRHP